MRLLHALRLVPAFRLYLAPFSLEIRLVPFRLDLVRERRLGERSCPD
jgi:hypothetical protein